MDPFTIIGIGMQVGSSIFGAVKAKKEEERQTNNSIKKRIWSEDEKHIIFGAKMAPKIDPKPLCFALGARFRARSTPRRVQGRFWETPGTKKNFGRAQKRPKEISQSFFAPSKHTTRGSRVFRTCILAPLS